jgi:hypothetical protein
MFHQTARSHISENSTLEAWLMLQVTTEYFGSNPERRIVFSGAVQQWVLIVEAFEGDQ